jgi:acyl-homoserine-lactone acylase
MLLTPNDPQGGNPMKKIIVITLLSLFVLFVGTSFADDEVLFGPEKYSRTKGKPNVFTDTFPAKADQGLRSKLTVIRGDQDKGSHKGRRVRSAEIRLNGSKVLGPKDFKGSVDRIEVPVKLKTNNTISVKLKGSPGSYLTVQIAYDIGPPYSAKIRWTSYGIPHILADDIGSGSFGVGYAFASQNACILADSIIKARGERAKYFGPGGNNNNVISDLFYKAMDTIQQAEDAFDTLDANGKAVMLGFTAGYNKYLSDHGLENFPCDTRWIKPITVTDYLTTTAVSRVLQSFMSYSYYAQPSATSSAKLDSDKTSIPNLASIPDFSDMQKASNAWALGRDKTKDGTGMVLGNPHYPWQGPNRFWESHLTIPGVMNVYGTSLTGSTRTAIGFTPYVAWTHTVCTSQHHTYYRLELKPGSPTTYMYDGGEREMTSRTVSVEVLQPDGSLETVTHTYYFSHFGPMILIQPWSDTYAWTIRSASEDMRGSQERQGMFTAKNMEEFKQAIAAHQAVNFVNTIAVDKYGVAWYADTGAVPNVTQAMLDGGCALFGGNPQYLDGTRSECEWEVDPDAAVPGNVPFKNIPQLTTTDYVSNSNNSYWLTNVENPITLDIPNRLWGRTWQPPEESDIGLRPRMGLKMIEDEAAADGKFSWEEFQAVLFNDRVLGAELLLDDLVDLCQANGASLSDEANEACDVLAGWDGTCTVDSVGAHIFREFMRFAPPTSLLYENQFDVNDPANTPNTLNVTNAVDILDALQDAVDRILNAGVPLDAPLGDIQFTWKKGVKIPIHGGGGREGAFNIVGGGSLTGGTLLPDQGELGGKPSSSFEDQQGYLINNGSSWMMLVEYTKKGPRAKGLVSYSQSTDRDSDHYDDQTYLFSQSKWRDLLWAEKDILADPNLRIEKITYDPPKNP